MEAQRSSVWVELGPIWLERKSATAGTMTTGESAEKLVIELDLRTQGSGQGTTS